MKVALLSDVVSALLEHAVRPLYYAGPRRREKQIDEVRTRSFDYRAFDYYMNATGVYEACGRSEAGRDDTVLRLAKPRCVDVAAAALTIGGRFSGATRLSKEKWSKNAV